MDKIKLLMDEYGLPESVAKEVEEKIHIGRLYDVKLYQWKSTPQDVVDKIVQSEPGFKMIPIIYRDDNWRPAIKNKKLQWTQDKVVGYTMDVAPKIYKVKFIIGAETLTIDDPFLIELLRKCLEGAKAQPSKSKGNQPKHPALKDLATTLMKFKSGTPYAKRVFVGQIFALYLDEFKDPSNNDDDLQKKVDGILNRKL